VQIKTFVDVLQNDNDMCHKELFRDILNCEALGSFGCWPLLWKDVFVVVVAVV